MQINLVSSINLPGWFEQDKKNMAWSAPVGLLSIASILQQMGEAVKVYDLTYEIDTGALPIGPFFYYDAAEKLLENDPDIVGFSTMCNSYHISLRLAEAVKKKKQKIIIVFGGPQATLTDFDTLNNFPWIDFILRGEAETTIESFINEIIQGKCEFFTPGLTWKNAHGTIIRNPDGNLISNLDMLPEINYDLVPYNVGDSLAIESGRGCPYSCSFCSTSTFWKRKFRVKSTHRLISEISTLYFKYGSRFLSFRHDIFTLDHKQVIDFCKTVKTTFPELKWGCSARLDSVNSELLKIMSEAGCCAIFYGLETGSPRMQKEINKNLNLENAVDIVKLSSDLGIDPTVSFITGFPAETFEDLKQTMGIIQELLGVSRTITQLHLLGPEKETPDWNKYHGAMSFDYYFSDIAGNINSLLEIDWFKQYPEIFSSFHYYESEKIPREFIKGIDIFAQSTFSVLRQTMLNLSNQHSLFEIYTLWCKWISKRKLDIWPADGRKVEDYLLVFYNFLEEEKLEKVFDLEIGLARDEILAFLIGYFTDTPVQWLEKSKVNS